MKGAKRIAICFVVSLIGCVTTSIRVLADDSRVKASVLRYMCSNKSESREKSYCMGYFTGFVQGNVVGRMEALAKIGIVEAGDLNSGLSAKYSLYCPRSSVSSEQLAEMFAKYMNDHPEGLDQPIEIEVTTMLIHYFPCMPEQSTSGGKK